MPCSRSLAGVVAASVMVGACGGSPESDRISDTSSRSSPSPVRESQTILGPVQLEMKNVSLHLDAGLILNVHYLRGEMISTRRDAPPVFDDARSYTVEVSRADVRLSMSTVTNLMNQHVFAYRDAPLKDLEVSVADGKLTQHGKLRKGVWLPFTVTATVAATPDGRLRLHAESIKVLGLGATTLLEMFGLTLHDVLKIQQGHGVDVSGNDVLISPHRVLPPPEMRGKLTRVALVEGQLQEVVGAASTGTLLAPDEAKAANYIYFAGSVLRFGKLTMTDADLQLIDNDPRDAFDFYPAEYKTQLVAGYSKNTLRGGLRTYLPDFDDLPAPVREPAAVRH